MARAFRALGCWLILGWLTAAAGAWDLTTWRPGRSARTRRRESPIRSSPYGSTRVMTRADQPPERGFGGRLMFYEGRKQDPVQGRRQAGVYAFDDPDRDANNARPDRK